MGFFVNLLRQISISYILEPLFIEAAKFVIENYWPTFPHIAVIEFPDFSGTYRAPSIKSGTYPGRLITTNQQDVLFLSDEHNNYLVGLVNPSDVFAYKGREMNWDMKVWRLRLVIILIYAIDKWLFLIQIYFILNITFQLRFKIKD